MAQSRRSSQALADGCANLALARRIVSELPQRTDRDEGYDDIKRVLADAADNCDELIRLLALEERVSLTAVRGNAQLALRRLEQTGDRTDPAAIRTALRAILVATDRLIHHIEELELVLANAESISRS